MVEYLESADGITEHQLEGFFVGWPTKPTPATLLKILCQSSAVELAVDSETKQVVGFANALTDGTLMAFIPLLEVLPGYQKQGIGSTLTQRLMTRLKDYYSIDLVCDEELVPFYGQLGFAKGTAMMIRNREALSNK